MRDALLRGARRHGLDRPDERGRFNVHDRWRSRHSIPIYRTLGLGTASRLTEEKLSIDPSSHLDLSERSGLPDEVAFLRASYPNDKWRAHENYGQLADFWLHVHATLRAEGADVVNLLEGLRDGRLDANSFTGPFANRLNAFLHHLDQHHRIEDAAYFPKFRNLDERMIIGFDLLERDHQTIHDQLALVVTGARGILQRLAAARTGVGRAVETHLGQVNGFVTLLQRHLADEEDLVIPALLKHGERPLHH